MGENSSPEDVSGQGKLARLLELAEKNETEVAAIRQTANSISNHIPFIDADIGSL